MNKYEFISDFLKKEKLDTSQKERVIKLIITELKNDGVNQFEIEERLKQIEKKLTLQTPSEQEGENINDQSPQTDLPNYIDPTQLSLFLKAYNQDPILKYSCHEFDDDGLKAINNKCGTETFNLEKYQGLLMKSFKELSRQYTIPNIGGLIYYYLNSGKEWSSDKIKINWNSPELLDWCRNNPGIAPNPGIDIIAVQKNNPGFDFAPFRSKIFGTTIGSFSQLVVHFKNLFHIRADNALKGLIQNVNAWNGWSNQIDFTVENFNDNIEFFTDVDKLLQAYKKIITIILEISKKHELGKPNVELSFEEVDHSVMFSIHHANSIYRKTIRNTLERTGQLHTGLIKNQINGLCDLYIRANFGDSKFARINLWNGKEREAKLIDKFGGVEYQLIFK